MKSKGKKKRLIENPLLFENVTESYYVITRRYNFHKIRIMILSGMRVVTNYLHLIILRHVQTRTEYYRCVTYETFSINILYGD